MVSKEFLSCVLPDGLIVIAKPKGRGFQHYVCENVEQAALQAGVIDREGGECYFALGSLKSPQLWNEKKEKWEVRVGANIAALKSLFADVDIDPDNSNKYASREEAIRAIKQFCNSTQFPEPMIVSSGGGLHLYWPLTKAIEATAWRPVAGRFKEGLLAYGLKIDPTRSADASSVLRVVGTHNYKHGLIRDVCLVRDVAPYSPKDMLVAVSALAATTGNLAPPITAVALLPDNTTRVYPDQDPPAFKPILMGCAQIQHLAQTGGASEPIWYAGLQVIRHCEESLKAATFISKNYPGFSPAEMYKKLNQLDANGIGPATCKQFQVSNPSACAGCSHWGKITSPIQLGRQVKEAAPPVVQLVTEQGTVEEIKIPNPPWPYARRATGGIVVRLPDMDGTPVAPMIIHDHDMYPVKRMYSERHETEATIWRVKQPLIGWIEITVDQKVLAEPAALHGTLLSKGVYVPPQRVKTMVAFMVAYISELQKQAVVEKAYSRLGWRDDGTTFVMSEIAYHADGVTTPHRASDELQHEMPGLKLAGTLEGWKAAIQFYNNTGYEAHRFCFYTAFGAPLMHMSGYHGGIINASGHPGNGKSTTMLAVTSVWGHPGNLMINGTKGGTTPNALQTLLGIYNNIPFCLDEITRMDPRILGELCLSVNQGQGKLRSTRAGTLVKARDTWSTIMLTSSNSDVYTSLASDRRDAAAEAMRAFQVRLRIPNIHTKAEADQFVKVELANNYGHASHVFIAYVVANYVAVKKLVQEVIQFVDVQGGVTPAERFWSALIAVNIAGAIIARKLGLIDGFPIEKDCKWATEQITAIRKTMKEHLSSPREILSEFLDSRVNETLSLSQINNSNISPRIDNVPRGGLTIRHELDNGVAWVMKTAFRSYCNEHGAHFSDIQDTLEREGILVDRNAQKVLGAGTDFAKGQVRCWVINMKELSK